MAKTDAYIWRKSVYDTAANDGIYRCEKCKAQLFNDKTGEFKAIVRKVPFASNDDYMFCPDCNNVVGMLKVIDSNETEFGKRMGKWDDNN